MEFFLEISFKKIRNQFSQLFFADQTKITNHEQTPTLRHWLFPQSQVRNQISENRKLKIKKQKSQNRKRKTEIRKQKSRREITKQKSQNRNHNCHCPIHRPTILEPTAQNKSDQPPHTTILSPPTHPGKSGFSNKGGLSARRAEIPLYVLINCQRHQTVDFHQLPFCKLGLMHKQLLYL